MSVIWPSRFLYENIKEIDVPPLETPLSLTWYLEYEGWSKGVRFGDAWGLGCLSQFEAQVQHLVVSELRGGGGRGFPSIFAHSAPEPVNREGWFLGSLVRFWKEILRISLDFHEISRIFEIWRDFQSAGKPGAYGFLWKSIGILLNSIGFYWSFLIFIDFNGNEPKTHNFHLFRIKNPGRKISFLS